MVFSQLNLFPTPLRYLRWLKLDIIQNRQLREVYALRMMHHRKVAVEQADLLEEVS